MEILEKNSIAVEPDVYLPRVARLIHTEDLTDKEKLFRLQFEDGRPLRHKPGQFVQVSLWGIGEAPISICSSPTREEYFELCVRRVGMVTEALHRLKEGQRIGIRGPYGKGVPVKAFEGYDVVLVAGGLGLAPLRSFIQWILHFREKFGRFVVLYGTRSPDDILFQKEIISWMNRGDVEMDMTVDIAPDWWYGKVGVITRLIEDMSFDPAKTKTLIVGPPVMYKYVIIELKKKNIPDEHIYMSLERRMKCGLGKCGHCQINDLYVCQDGPVFHYPDIKIRWEAL